jgi:hypothetical protein
MFEYDEAWLTDCNRFSIEPALTLTRGAFPMPRNQKIFGSIGDSAPDTWGRRLMQRSERRQTEKEQRPVKTLTEADYLLGVADANASRRTSLPLDWQSDAPGATPSPVSLPLLNWGGYGERNCVGKDPSLGIRRKNPTARQAIWVYDETQRLIARAGTMGFKGLQAALAVAWDTMMSPVDVRSLTLSHMARDGQGGVFQVEPKTSRRRSARSRPTRRPC